MKLTFWYYRSLGVGRVVQWTSALISACLYHHLVIIGTLSKGDDDGSENVGKTMNLHSFKLNRVYLDPLKCQMQATCPP